MRKISLTIMIALGLVASALAAESAATKYTCVMHPEVVMDAPGECPKCGMTLVPVKTEEKKRPTSNVQRPTSNEEKTAGHRDHDFVQHEAKRVQADRGPEVAEMTMASSLNLT